MRLQPLRDAVASRHTHSVVAIVAAIVWLAAAAFAQSGEIYKVHLSPVPMDPSMVATVAGSGSLTATLRGKKLTITGTFAGLKSPATEAHIHHGPKAVRGPAILDVPVPGATSGTINASIELTPEQIDDLRSDSLYIQISSQGAPSGNLWGWLLRQK
jgi:hypothetical protein